MNNFQIIGIDMANKRFEDFSCVASVCGNCRKVLECKTYDKYQNNMSFSFLKKCPYCNVEFSKHIINE